MENKMERDGDMGAHDGMTQGTDTESDDGATADMAMDRPSIGMEDTAPAMDDVGDGMSMFTNQISAEIDDRRVEEPEALAALAGHTEALRVLLAGHPVALEESRPEEHLGRLVDEDDPSLGIDQEHGRREA